MKQKKEKNISGITQEYVHGFTDGRRAGHSEGYELGLKKGYERAMSDVADFALLKMEGPDGK